MEKFARQKSPGMGTDWRRTVVVTVLLAACNTQSAENFKPATESGLSVTMEGDGEVWIGAPVGMEVNEGDDTPELSMSIQHENDRISIVMTMDAVKPPLDQTWVLEDPMLANVPNWANAKIDGNEDIRSAEGSVTLRATDQPEGVSGEMTVTLQAFGEGGVDAGSPMVYRGDIEGKWDAVCSYYDEGLDVNVHDMKMESEFCKSVKDALYGDAGP